VVATATFAGLVGAGTLGAYVYEGFATHDYDELYGGVVLVAVLCIVLERLFALVQRTVSRRTGQAGSGGDRRQVEESAPAMPVAVP
jgi:osmoprotectant transport system permease protein